MDLRPFPENQRVLRYFHKCLKPKILENTKIVKKCEIRKDQELTPYSDYSTLLVLLDKWCQSFPVS